MTLNELINKISAEEIIELYINQNNTREQTASKLGILPSQLDKLKKHFNIVKPEELSYKLRVESSRLKKEQTVEKIKKTKLERYGSENYNNPDKMKQTKIEKYGTYFNNPEKAKKTCLEKYGVTYSPESRIKTSQTKLERYGSATYNNTDKTKQTKFEKYGDANYVNVEKCKKTKLERYGTENYVNVDKIKQTCLERYGVDNIFKSEEFKEHSKQLKLEKYGDENYRDLNKTRQTCQERYGYDYACMRPEARSKSGNNSGPNVYFENLLKDNGLEYQKEFPIENRSYDFKVGNNLIEINPTATHNSTWGIYGTKGKDKYYHRDKSNLAEINGYRCIQVWDWDNIDSIIDLLNPRPKVFARKCSIELVPKSEATEFINKYHIQGYAKDTIRIGLYYDHELISIMTFGKPRYNKKYEYELIRYCSSKNVIGGAKKLFSYFIKHYNPQSIISYCDKSKFTGKTYYDLGFKHINESVSKHWYNIKTKQHITDGLLRQRGFDQLFNTNYGKGTSNVDLILQAGFVEVYDCGQATFVFNNK